MQDFLVLNCTPSYAGADVNKDAKLSFEEYESLVLKSHLSCNMLLQALFSGSCIMRAEAGLNMAVSGMNQ